MFLLKNDGKTIIQLGLIIYSAYGIIEFSNYKAYQYFEININPNLIPFLYKLNQVY